MEIRILKKEGLSDRHIARRLGMDPRTVKKYAQEPEKAFKTRSSVSRESKLSPFIENVVAWLEKDMGYSAVWIYDHLKPMGYTGGYEIVKRFVRKVKAERTRIAYLRFETQPGHQAQVDWGEFVLTLPDGMTQTLYLFAMILGYSRMLYAEFVERCDMTTFLDCHIRAFDYFGGVPDEILYDRMKNVFIRKLAGKTIFNRSLVSLGLHYNFKPIVSPAYAPWVKGKVERPIPFVREGFWRGYGFTGLERSNRDLMNWLEMKSLRIHGTTHEQVQARFMREKPSLCLLPGTVFDTSYIAYRTVHKDCSIHFETNRYMAPHRLVGQQLVLRVKDKRIRIFRDNDLIVSYNIPDAKGQFIAEPKFIDALKNDREMNLKKYGREKAHKQKGKAFTISPTIPPWAVDVQVRSLNVYDLIPEKGDSRKEAA